MKIFKRILFLSILAVLVCFCFTGCRKPYDKPEFVTIEPSQSAFLVPLVGDGNNQNAFDSEEMLNSNKVATKEIQIPHRWVQTGRKHWVGSWKASARLIIVERKPISRSWVSGDSSAESANKAIFGETSDNIGIYVGMNCTAMIEETDAAKYLYRYGDKPLEEIIDIEVKALVEERFNIEVAKVSSSELGVKKGEVVSAVKEYVTTYFKNYGITITVLGLKEGISFENPEIQKALDAKFESEQDLVIQQNKNEAALAKAEAEAQAMVIAAQAAADAKLKEAQAQVEIAKAEAEATRVRAEAEAEANKKVAQSLTDELLEKMWYEAWNGELPYIYGSDMNSLIQIPTNK